VITAAISQFLQELFSDRFLFCSSCHTKVDPSHPQFALREDTASNILLCSDGDQVLMPPQQCEAIHLAKTFR
jgi:hypothetical protein